ncbi:prolyl hydroxylase family protein [Nocardioides sp. MAHUQ-72]|uniref:prolyl hydroxylase family protein n=1 Tax=unclassified Nocardioides TaxID=2615069 RepID=UPI00361B04A4
MIPTDDVLVVDGYLDASACVRIVAELDYVLWRDSAVVRADGHGNLVTFQSEERTSRSTTQKWFGDALNAEIGELEARIEADFGPPTAYLEHWQAVRYAPGGRFGLHTDGGAFRDDPAGERVLTFLACVEAPEAGGETYFPRLGRLVEPVAGRLVVWRNLLADQTADPRFLHAATPTRAGAKTVLTTWSRQRPARGGA